LATFRELSPENKILSETIKFRGHENILATHRNTLEITKEPEISRRADCIVGVSSSKSCPDLDPKIVSHIKSGGALAFRITVEDSSCGFLGFGSRELQLSDPKEMVLRRSDFISPRTLAIRCDAAAVDLPRILVSYLQDPDIFGTLEIAAVTGPVSAVLEEIPAIEFL
jgi:uncharacterized protein